MLSPELATELRSARPTASPELRERVLAVAAREEPRRTPRFTRPPHYAVIERPAKELGKEAARERRRDLASPRVSDRCGTERHP